MHDTNLATATPLMRDVETLLRDRIRSGHYEAGDRLPSEREICEELKVHRRVVRTAIKRLERDGLVTRRPNCRPIIGPSDSPIGGPSLASAAASVASKQQLSRFVALIMWPGSAQEEGATGQQRIFWGMNQALGQAGYHAVFLDLGKTIDSEDEYADRETAHLQYAADHGFGGIVYYCYSYDSNRELLRSIGRKMPLVLIDRELYGVEADFVGITNRQAMYDATNYLIGLGHRRIAYVTRSEPVNTVQDRLQGYLHALRDTFHSNHYEMVLSVPSTGGHYWPGGDAILRLPADERPTALLCVNDFEAVEVVNRLTRLGLDVPRDMSIIGCDNVVTKLPNGIGLTTIAQPFEEIGTTAANLFLRRTHLRKVEAARIECPTRLIVRESCRPLVEVGAAVAALV